MNNAHSRLLARLGLASASLVVTTVWADPPQSEPHETAVSLGPEPLRDVNARDVFDLLRYLPDSSVSKRFAGDEGVISLRGTNAAQSARTLVMVDGFVVSNFLGSSEEFAPKLNILGPSEVRQIDVLYGPYSARHGGNSMGGVVSITTLEPAQKSGYVRAAGFAMPFEDYGIDETFTGYSVEAGGSWKESDSPWSARLSARHIDNVGQPATYLLLAPSSGPSVPVQGAYVDPRLATPVFGASSPSSVVTNQFRGRVGYEFKSGWKIEGHVFGSLTDRELVEPRTFLADTAGAPVYNARVNFDGTIYTATGLDYSLLQRSEFLVGVKATGAFGEWRTSLTLSRYWIDTEDERTSFDYATGAANQLGTWRLQDDPGWSTLQADIERDFGRNRLAFGVTADRYETSQSNYGTASWRYATTPVFLSETFGTTASAGVYVEDEIALTSAASLTLGVRADTWKATDGGVAQDVGLVVTDTYPDREESAVSPKLAFRWTPNDSLDVRLALGTATRFPTVGELFQGSIDGSTLELDPDSFDPGLEPERSRDANFSVQTSFETLRLTTTLFYQDVDDAIYRFTGLNRFGNLVDGYKNIDRVRQFGIEFMAAATDVLVDGLDLDFSVARIDARTVSNRAAPASEDEMFPRIPQWRGTGNLRYRMGERLRASIGVRYSSQPYSDLFGLSRGDAYGFYGETFFADARLAWKINDAFEASLGVDNFTNERVYGFQPLAQRSALAELKINF